MDTEKIISLSPTAPLLSDWKLNQYQAMIQIQIPLIKRKALLDPASYNLQFSNII